MNDLPSSRSIPRWARRAAWDRSGGGCALCGTPMVAGEVHHLIPRASGGGHDLWNLIAVCPTCHRTFPHRLYRPDEAPIVAAAGRRWHAAMELERAVYGTQRWRAPARRLVAKRTRETVLVHGLYAKAKALAGVLLARAQIASVADVAPADRVLMAELLILSADMSYYLGPTAGDLADLSAAARLLAGAEEDTQRQATHLSLAQARLLRVAGRRDEEAEVLMACDPTPSQRAELRFRMLSLELISAGAYPVPAEVGSAPIAPARTLAGRIDLINITADKGRLQIAGGEHEEAYRALARAFMMARLLFFRRNLHATGLSLAKLSVDLDEPQWAADWWSVAAQFAPVGFGATLSVEGVRRDIIDAFGESPLRRITVNANRLHELAGALGAGRGAPS